MFSRESSMVAMASFSHRLGEMSGFSFSNLKALKKAQAMVMDGKSPSGGSQARRKLTTFCL